MCAEAGGVSPWQSAKTPQTFAQCAVPLRHPLADGSHPARCFHHVVRICEIVMLTICGILRICYRPSTIDYLPGRPDVFSTSSGRSANLESRAASLPKPTATVSSASSIVQAHVPFPSLRCRPSLHIALSPSNRGSYAQQSFVVRSFQAALL